MFHTAHLRSTSEIVLVFILVTDVTGQYRWCISIFHIQTWNTIAKWVLPRKLEDRLIECPTLVWESLITRGSASMQGGRRRGVGWCQWPSQTGPSQPPSSCPPCHNGSAPAPALITAGSARGLLTTNMQPTTAQQLNSVGNACQVWAVLQSLKWPILAPNKRVCTKL